jgi:hypothetical protein
VTTPLDLAVAETLLARRRGSGGGGVRGTPGGVPR